MLRLIALALVFISIATTSSAQLLSRLTGGPPTIVVALEHPPSLKLSVSRVAFGRSTGPCAPELVDALIDLFVTEGVEVVDRAHVESLLAEHEFSDSGLVERTHMAELGNILGPAALIFVKSRRCATEQQRLVGQESAISILSQQDRGPKRISRTIGYFKGTVQVIDLSTARIHSARAIDERSSRQHEGYGGQPAFPSDFEVTDQVVKLAALRVRQMFFPWREQKDLRFYDSSECDLKLAYNLVLSGDYEAARAQSERNVTSCGRYRAKKPRLLAHAYYNLAMTQFLVGSYDESLASFEQSLRLKPSEVTSEAMAECRKAQQTAMAMERFERQAAEMPRVASGSAVADEETTLEGRLRRLQALHEKGLLSEEEYQAKREEILADL